MEKSVSYYPPLQNWCDSVFCYISIHPFFIIYQIFTVFNTKIEHDLTKLEIFTYRKLFLIIHARIFYQLSFLRFLFAILYFFSKTSGFAHIHTEMSKRGMFFLSKRPVHLDVFNSITWLHRRKLVFLRFLRCFRQQPSVFRVENVFGDENVFFNF